MRKTLLAFILIISFSNCSNDDTADIQILGDWALVRASFYGLDENENEGLIELDYSGKNIVYTFNINGTLVIDGEAVGFSPGTYDFKFIDGHLSEFPFESDPTISLVLINGSKWVYNSSDGIMTLGSSYIDGVDLFLRKK